MCFKIVLHTIFFDLWGFLTEYPHTQCYHRFAYFVLLLNFCLAIFLLFYTGYFVTYLLVNFKILEAMNEFSQYWCLLLTYWIILIETFCKRGTQRSFWTHFKQLNDVERIKGNSLYLYELVECFILSLTTLVIHCHIWSIPLDILIPYFTMYYIVQVRVFYYVFSMKLIASIINNINMEIEEMERLWEERFENSTGNILNGVKKRLWHIQRTHFTVHELVRHINNNFSCSSLAIILCQFYVLCSNLNWLCLHSDQYQTVYIIGIAANLFVYDIVELNCFKHQTFFHQFILHKFPFLLQFIWFGYNTPFDLFITCIEERASVI